MNRTALVATIAILVRQGVAIAHGMAHEQLGVGLTPWQQAFVYTVISIVPFVALALYWTRYARTGALLLWTSMLAGMLFGVYYHFIEISPDHVGHLPAGAGQSFFIATAVLLVPTELVAAAVGLWDWLRLRKSVS